ncbi:molybdopterin-dependent oxidoreductase [Arcobacteraceae bacterium]|nr:molybdopterin-dependent oxidoreductase [Arcobacteraceae bacterium]
MKLTACPMDCFDACEIVYTNGKCKPSDNYITNNKLCKNFAYLLKEKNIIDEELENTLQKVANKLKQANQKVLYYKGTGNLAVMQKIPMQFFEKIGATFAEGDICCDGGGTGIKMGRKYNVNPTIEELQSSEVILVWGRNFTQTSAHIYKLVKDKIFITIDPIQTPIAKKSEVYLQIPPKGDYLLSKLLQQALNNETIDPRDLKKLNITQEQFSKTIELLTKNKVSVMLGIGAQKYKEGADIFHEMDKVFDKLKLFEKKNTGVWYLGNGAYPYENKISVNPTKTCTYADVKFDDYDVVFIQAANPVISAPNSKYIIESLKNTFVIFMGTTANETSQYADIIIPAKTFLQKRDVRLSYGHDEVSICEICEENDYAVSEYELTSYLFKELGLDGLLSEDEYLDCFKTKVRDKPDITFTAHEIKEVELLDMKDDEYYLITSKHTDSLNSQFKYDEYAYVHPNSGFENDQLVTIASKINSIEIKVKNDEKVFPNSILIYAGNKEVNKLTSNQLSDCGTNATYQDIKLTIKAS